MYLLIRRRDKKNQILALPHLYAKAVSTAVPHGQVLFFLIHVSTSNHCCQNASQDMPLC